jgi:uncharacterized protein (TIGR02996 family)
VNEELEILRKCAENPADAGQHLVYADWLDDHGRPDDAARVRTAAGFVRRVEFAPAYDRRPKKAGDPDYGIHGVDLRLALVGPKGAVQFVLFTNWHLPEVQGSMLEHQATRLVAGRSRQETVAALGALFTPLPADLGYHSKRPMYEGQEPMGNGEPCDYLGVPCYYDGSGLGARRPWEALLRGGHEAVWKLLEDEYRDRFDPPEGR